MIIGYHNTITNSPATAPVGVSSSSSILAMAMEAVGPGTGGDIGLEAAGGGAAAVGESSDPDGFRPSPDEDDV